MCTGGSGRSDDSEESGDNVIYTNPDDKDYNKQGDNVIDTNTHRAALAPTSRALTPIKKEEEIRQRITEDQVRQGITEGRQGKDQVRQGITEERQGNIVTNKKRDSSLFPNPETEPTRVRRMRGEVPQKDDPI